MKQIVFLGIKHCGKTTQGRLLAAALGLPFADSDALLEERYREMYGVKHSVREIMTVHGAEVFRRMEAGVIRAQCGRSDRVLALGGGGPVNEFLSVETLKALGFLIWLEIAPEAAFERIVRGGIPPFLAGDDPHGKFMKQYRERAVRYGALADWRLAVGGADAPEKVHEAVMAGLKERRIL